MLEELMADTDVMNHRQLIIELVKHCKERASGTVFFNLVRGESARIVLKQGVICWIAYEQLRGEEAIDAIATISEARFNFNPLLKLAIGKQQLPSTSGLLKRLGRVDGETSPAQALPMVRDIESPRDSGEEISGNRPYSQDLVRAALEKEALEFLGPMAKVLCADYMKTKPMALSHEDVRGVIKSLMQDINDEVKQRSFANRAKRALNLA
jgi:hypothetical protein